MLIKLMVHIKDRKQRSYLTFLTSKVSVPENCISNPRARIAEQSKGFYAHYIAVHKVLTFVAKKQYEQLC